MPEKKKGKGKIVDITRKEELTEKDMSGVSGGVLKPRPTFKTVDDCGGNCMGSVPTATGKQVDL